jgi:hypothetical protein
VVACVPFSLFLWRFPVRFLCLFQLLSLIACGSLPLS